MDDYGLGWHDGVGRILLILDGLPTTDHGMTLDHLGELRLLRQAVEEQTEALVRNLRSQGRSWSQIGEQLRVSKQAAQQRYA